LPSKGVVLDLCSGTGDLSFMIFKYSGFKGLVLSIDASIKMLLINKKRTKQKNLNKSVIQVQSDALSLPLKKSSVDAVMMAFGIRNLFNPEMGLEEIFKVLKPKGELIILEFTIPGNKFIKIFYEFYLFKLLPRIGTIISKDKGAYQYLSATIEEFNKNYSIEKNLIKTGFSQVKLTKLSLGIATIYYSTKS
jgi:demethylmenaquinone methyltransferase/2-methoxy-6-polyprenyl-1,4-benzoquinol methylase